MYAEKEEGRKVGKETLNERQKGKKEENDEEKRNETTNDRQIYM